MSNFIPPLHRARRGEHDTYFVCPTTELIEYIHTGSKLFFQELVLHV
jgi:hypothetical protein